MGIDQQGGIAGRLEGVLEGAGYHVQIATSDKAAIKICMQEQVNPVLETLNSAF